VGEGFIRGSGDFLVAVGCDKFGERWAPFTMTATSKLVFLKSAKDEDYQNLCFRGGFAGDRIFRYAPREEKITDRDKH
jgi:hypothetical protein